LTALLCPSLQPTAYLYMKVFSSQDGSCAFSQLSCLGYTSSRISGSYDNAGGCEGGATGSWCSEEGATYYVVVTGIEPWDHGDFNLQVQDGLAGDLFLPEGEDTCPEPPPPPPPPPDNGCPTDTFPSPGGLPLKPVHCGETVTVTVDCGKPTKAYKFRGAPSHVTFNTCGRTNLKTSLGLYDNEHNVVKLRAGGCGTGSTGDQTKLQTNPFCDTANHQQDFILVPSTVGGVEGSYTMKVQCKKLTGKEKAACQKAKIGAKSVVKTSTTAKKKATAKKKKTGK